MIVIKEIDCDTEIYNLYKEIEVPYYFCTSYEKWKESLMNDKDGEGRKLFLNSFMFGAYEEGKLVGFIQYGVSAFGFDENGEISGNIHYQIIRNLYFDEKNKNAGELLLKKAIENFNAMERVYAFFHYFGMSVYARHGKLFEKYDYIGKMLEKNGFIVEHENVYYSMKNLTGYKNEIEMKWLDLSIGHTQCAEFMYDNEWIGECEVHFVSNKIAYLRWIYIDEKKQNQKLGSSCIQALMKELAEKGYERLDTDTAMTNTIAKHYYEKNGFNREGTTRSYYLDVNK